MSRLVERFLRYVKVDTQSNDSSKTTPSTLKQFDLAKILVEECQNLGFDQVELSKSGIVYATLLGSDDSKDPIGFLAHMDTATEMSGKGVNPRIIKNYDGSLIQLNETYSMSCAEYPNLSKCIGEDLIVTDGNTLLGGDDKAGIAIILTAIENIIQSNQPHGKIMVAFTCDEEVGRGTQTFDYDKFDVDYAYTVDGGDIECIDYENFNAAKVTITIKGKTIHPGDAKDKMINASLVANELISMLPKDQTPSTTQGRQGFYHLLQIQGDVEECKLVYLLREHDDVKFDLQKQTMTSLIADLNQKYGHRIELMIQDQYKNMFSFIKNDMRCIDRAIRAIHKAGIQAVSKPVRGGTDGAMLSENGLLCPNLGTGTYNHHGRYEFASVQKMEKVVEIVGNIILDE